MSAKTISDFQKITGLKEEQAKSCFEKFGGYAGALASFVQSYDRIPKEYFESNTAAKTHASEINKELKDIYKRAREQKKQLVGKTDEEVWKHLSKLPTTTTSSAPAPAQQTSAPTTDAKPALGASGFSFGSKPAPAQQTSAPTTDAKPAFGASGFSFGSKPAPASEQSSFNFGGSNAGAAGATTTAAFAFGAASGKNPGMNFGFGTAAPTSSDAASPVPMMSGFGAQPVAVGKEEEEETKPKKSVVYCDPKHDVGPFLDMPGFWEQEVEAGASLFNLDGGFLARNRDTLRPMMEKWLEKARFYRKPVQYVEMEDRDEETVRVIIKDADRSFLETRHREKLVAFLHAMLVEFGNYGQAMSYLAGLCMLALNEEETASIIRFVSSEYIKGHWAAEAVGFSTSAWVVEFFMKKQFPDVAKHLTEDLKFWPDTYLQKILTGLCIHVLSFNELFQFLDAFMNGGLNYLICFCLAVVEHFRDNLLKIRSSVEANSLYEMMSLNSRVCHVSDVRAILQRAPLISLGDDADQLSLIRSQVYEEKVSPRLKKAPKVDTFEPCELCEKHRPTWYCDDLGAVCEQCKGKNSQYSFEKY